MILYVKGWGKFQHYKDRAPPWIKLHKSLLDDYAYQCLPIASRALAPMLWLIASESDNGSFDGDVAKIAFRLRTSQEEVKSALQPLIDSGFMVTEPSLADCAQDVCLETEVETELEKEAEAEKKKKRSASSSGERLAVDWECPADWIADAMQIKPAWDEKQALDVADGFRDYWISVAGIKGRKADWRATWRNWVRNQRDIKQARSGPLSAAEDRQRASELLTGRNRGNGERTYDGTATIVS
jgi:hypothetical protein